MSKSLSSEDCAAAALRAPLPIRIRHEVARAASRVARLVWRDPDRTRRLRRTREEGTSQGSGLRAGEKSPSRHAARASIWAIAAMLVALPFALPVHADEPVQNELRLVDGEGDHHGRVEIFHDDRWGLVCDDLWDMKDARVVCRQLGFNGAEEAIHRFEPANTNLGFWLDNVNCRGSERELGDCPRYSNQHWGENNCTSIEGAGVRCKLPGAEVLLSPRSLAITEEDTSGGTYTVVLGFAPTADVTVTIGGTSGTDISTSTSSLAFTTTDWNIAQTVTVTAVADTDLVDDTATITHTASGGGYADAPVANLRLTVVDNDVPSVTVKPQSLTVVEEDTTGGTYTVVLNTEPTGNVTVSVRLGGQLVGGAVGPGAGAPQDDSTQPAAAVAERSVADRFRNGGKPKWRSGPGSSSLTQRDFLIGSSFSLTGGTRETGTFALWGRGAVASFDGRDGALSLDGEVTSGMLGADWSRGAVMAGLVAAHNRSDGGYRGETGSGGIESSLTGLYPWGRVALSERLSLWGVAGYGEGRLTLTPDGDPRIGTDLDLVMAAGGLRGVVVQRPETGGMELAVKTDAMGVRTSSSRALGLVAEEAEVTRLRLGLEGSRVFLFEGGASLTPSAEIGMRHDDGDAETGFGVDIGGGLDLSDPLLGLSAELRGRGLLTHAEDGFRDRGLSGSLSWDPRPETARGLKLTMTRTVGGPAAGGMDALLEPSTLAGLAAADDRGDGGTKSRQRFETRLGYGLSAFGDRFTATPEIGFGYSGTQRDYRLGWLLTRGGRLGGGLEMRLEGTRREGAGGDAGPEHALGFRLKARF